jgi:uncharacterized damage-inducible protein DinB
MNKREGISKIYIECVDLNIKVLESIPPDQLIWKPGADSRSIAEIGRHLIRVDNMLLAKIDIKPVIEDTFSNESELIINAFNIQKDYITGIVNSSPDDEEFNKVIKKVEGNDISLKSTMIHIIHHHLYHYAQITYLRRVNDRNWKTPEKKWEKTVDHISDLIQ